MNEFVETSRDGIVGTGEFATDMLHGVNTGAQSGKMLILSPTGQVVGIQDDDTVIIQHKSLLDEVVGQIEARKIPITSAHYFLNADEFSRMEVDFKIDLRAAPGLPEYDPIVVLDDPVDFGMTLTNDIGTGQVGFEIMGWRRVCENGLIAFVPQVAMRKARTEYIAPDDISKSIQFCLGQWTQNVLKRYRDMVTVNITKDEALVRVGHLNITKEDKDQTVKIVEAEFDKAGVNTISMWLFFNALMFMSTHYLERHRRARFTGRVENELSPKCICYNGVPHIFRRT